MVWFFWGMIALLLLGMFLFLPTSPNLKKRAGRDGDEYQGNGVAREPDDEETLQ